MDRNVVVKVELDVSEKVKLVELQAAVQRLETENAFLRDEVELIQLARRAAWKAISPAIRPAIHTVAATVQGRAIVLLDYSLVRDKEAHKRFIESQAGKIVPLVVPNSDSDYFTVIGSMLLIPDGLKLLGEVSTSLGALTSETGVRRVAYLTNGTYSAELVGAPPAEIALKDGVLGQRYGMYHQYGTRRRDTRKELDSPQFTTKPITVSEEVAKEIDKVDLDLTKAPVYGYWWNAIKADIQNDTLPDDDCQPDVVVGK